LKIVCLVKQVPHPPAIEFDPEEKRLRREGVPLELNPFDRAAVLAAAELRDRTGGDLVPPQAEEALRETLALGADRAVHLADEVFAVADTLGTSRTLALAIEKLGADLVVCGRKTVDGETSQVPPEVAAFLEWPVLTSAVSVDANGAGVRVRRQTDDGEEVFDVDLPAVVSMAHAELEPVDPAATGRLERWTASDLVPDVHPNDRRFGQPGSPTRVLAVRDAAPERRGERAPSAEAAAAVVRGLLEERTPEPSSWEKPGHIAELPGAGYDSWSVVEIVDGRPSRASLELIARSRELAGKLGGRAGAVVLGAEVAAIATDVAQRGAEDVYVVDDPALASYHPARWATALEDLVDEHRPHVVLIPASTRGREYGPLLAGMLELGMTGDCVGVDIAKAGRLLQTKPAYGGNIVSVIMGATTPQLATVRPRMYQPLERRDDADATIYHVPLGPVWGAGLRLVSREAGAAAYVLDEARVIVLAGPEVGRDGIRELEELASASGAALGGTREVCDARWLPANQHIGLSGRQVAPLLLVAVGVPGDFEHLTGFVKARVTVTFTADESAPIVGAADVAVVGDWRENLPRFHELVGPDIPASA
jgi:electron transfer flavoprotein alpha subunit